MHHHTTAPAMLASGAPSQGIDALRRFFQDNAAGLRHAADLLGGPRHAKSVDEIVDLLAQQSLIGRRARRLIDELLLLLSLELVDDLESEEAHAFSLVQLDHPAVADICALTDGLRAAIAGARDVMWPRAPVTLPHAA